MKIDHVHFYSDNAVELRNWFRDKLGFSTIGNCITEHTHTEFIALNKIVLAISSPLTNISPVAKYLSIHPPGVADIAFRVDDLDSIISRSLSLGCYCWEKIQPRHTSRGSFKFAQISGWGDLLHTLVETQDNLDFCWPWPITFKSEISYDAPPFFMSHIDHVVLNVMQGQLDAAAEFYQKLLGLNISQSFHIQTDYSGLISKALSDEQEMVRFNINQPSSSDSQIQEFLDWNCGAGIQHMALHTDNLTEDVIRMRQQGLDFLPVSLVNYQNLEHRTGLDLSLEELQEITRQQILVDQDKHSAESLLMQIFTQPIFSQPTFFLEFIERRNGASGFGHGNFTALFSAVEKAQNLRALVSSKT